MEDSTLGHSTLAQSALQEVTEDLKKADAMVQLQLETALL